MMIFIVKSKGTDLTKDFYRFTNCHQLGYADKIRVEGTKGELIHSEITVGNYLLTLPE